MSTPPEAHYEHLERTDALPRLDLNVLAEATPINSDLLTRTDSWAFEVLQEQRWSHPVAFTAGSRAAVPRVDTSNLRAVDDGCVEMLTPFEIGLGDAAANASNQPLVASDSAPDPTAMREIAAALEQEIVLFAEEHTAGTAIGTLEPQLEKANALHSLTDLAFLLDTDTPQTQLPLTQLPVTQLPVTQLSGSGTTSAEGTATAEPVETSVARTIASSTALSEESITWMEIPEEYAPSTLADGAQELGRLLDREQDGSSCMARSLALKLMDRDGPVPTIARTVDVATLELDPRSLVQALFPRSHHEQQAELLSARQTIEEIRESNVLLQQAIGAAQERVEYLKSEVERHNELAAARDSQLATSIEELTSRRLAMRELERVIQSRDELIAGLRAELDALRIELQTAKDERGIMAINLNKARERTKTLRQQLLEKNLVLQNLHVDPAERTQTFARANGEAVSELPERVLVPIDHGGSSIQLNRPTMTIGRTPTPTTDICIPSTLISRQHARLIISAEAVVVEDLNSTNGCFVNDRRVQKKMVREGDVLTLADMKYRLSQKHPQGMLTD